MKQVTFLFTIALCFLCTTIKAQVLFSETFDNYAVGELNTDHSGSTPGKGGWYVKENAFPPYTLSVEVVPENGRGNVVVISSGNGKGTTASLTKKQINTLWNNRTAGNNVLKFEYDVFFVSDTVNVISVGGGLLTTNNLRTPMFRLFNHYTTTNNQVVISDTDAYLNADYHKTPIPPTEYLNLGLNNNIKFNNFPYNSWITVEFFIDYSYEAGNIVGGTIYLYIPSLNILSAGGTFTHNEIVDNIYIVASNTGVSALSAKYDNIKITALNQMPDLKANVNDIISQKISLFPNPATNVVTITNSENMLVNQVVVYDTTGKQISTQNFNTQATIQLNVEHLASGTYMLHITTHEGTAVKKLVKK